MDGWHNRRWIRLAAGGVLLGLLIGTACRPRSGDSGQRAEDQPASGQTLTGPAAPAPLGPPDWPPSGLATAGRSSSGWPTLFGPFHNSISLENDVVTDWPPGGPPQKWRRPIGKGYSAPVGLGDRLVVFYREGDREIVECLDAESGATRWTFPYPSAYSPRTPYSDGPYSTPVLEETRVYALGAEGKLHCLDLGRGTEIWARRLCDDYEVVEGLFAVATSPLVDGDRVIVNVGGRARGAGIVALDKHSGRTLWTATRDGASCATPRAATIHGRRYVFVWTFDALVSLDPESGHVGWRIPFRAHHPDTINASSPLIENDVVFVSGYQLGSLCVRVLPDRTYRELWRGKKRVLDSQYNNLVGVDGYVYGFSTIGRSLRCVELLTGRLMWKWRSRVRHGASIAVDGRLLLFGERGRLASVDIDPRRPVPRSMTDDAVLPGRCFTAPALHRGLLYLRNEETLVCFDLRKSARSDRPVPVAAVWE
jgi:outer membrane protein assembly factor BamB